MTNPALRHARAVEYLDLMRRAAALSRHVPGGSIQLAFVPRGAGIESGRLVVQHPLPDGGYALVPQQLPIVEDLEPLDPQLEAEILAATRLATELWVPVVKAGGPAGPATAPIHFERVVDPEFLAGLVLPIGDRRPDEQAVTLVERDGSWRPMHDVEEIDSAYAERPRTRTYVSLEIGGYGPYALAALLLSGLARCRVVCTPYESDAGDATIGEHGDQWYGIAVQVEGEKHWMINDPAGRPTKVPMRPGDVLLVPRQARHNVVTPAHSVHVLYAVLTHEPLDGATRDQTQTA